MPKVVRVPFGELIARDSGWELRWVKAEQKVYAFTRKMRKSKGKSPPVWTGRWNVREAGSPEKAKKAYSGYSKQIDEICR